MSRIDRSISNHDVIPVIDSNVFEEDPGARLACGMIAINGVPLPGFETEYAAHFQLRKKVYVDQTGQLAADDLQADGTDRDADDARSITFAVFENREGGARVIGVARLIVRGIARPLPVEEFCPEVFASGELDTHCVEVSRVIARHESAALQGLVQTHLFAQMLAYLSDHRLGRTFAILEPWLERHVKGVLVIARIGEVRYVEHYLDENVPIEVDVAASVDRVNANAQALVDRYRDDDHGMRFFGRLPKGSAVRQAAR